MKKRAVVLLCVLFISILTACGNSKDANTITKLEISPKSAIAVAFGNKVNTSLNVTLYTEAGRYKYDDADQQVQWVSTNPEVAVVSCKEREACDLKYQVKADIKLISEGTAEIYAQTVDGSVLSERVELIYGTRFVKEHNKPYDESPITKLELSPKGDMEIQSGKESPQLSVTVSTSNGYYKNYDGAEKVEWISTNPEVAAVSSKEPEKYDSTYKVKANINLVSEGITEIYAQTADGNVVSNTVKVVYGNKFNKEDTIEYDVGMHVIQKLKYPTKTTEQLRKIRPSYVFENRMIFVYHDRERGSNVQATEIAIDGQQVKAKGMINTFTEYGTEANCNFSLVLDYNDSFTEYTVISEAYGSPELILPNLD